MTLAVAAVGRNDYRVPDYGKLGVGRAPMERKYQQVVSRIEKLIAAGTFIEGQRIPSVRDMAKQMHLSVTTVQEGYRRLEDLGTIECQPQSGYYVRFTALRKLRSADLPEAEHFEIPREPRIVEIPEHIWALRSLIFKPGLDCSLGMGFVPSELYPGDELCQHMHRALKDDPGSAIQYQLGAGVPRLREEIARRMMESGCSCSPDELIVTVGATEAIHLCFQSVADPGDAVLVESPGYYGFFSALAHLHMQAIEVPSDPQSGVSIPFIRAVLSVTLRVRAIVLSPTVSNPTGAIMPAEARRDLIELCRENHVAIIEDDLFGDLTFDTPRPRSLKADAPDDVLYVGSFSKTLAPGFRVGWVAGGRWQEKLARRHATAVLGVPAPIQMGVAAYLAKGGYSRHLRKLRERFRENVARFRQGVCAAFPEQTRIADTKGGHLLWVELPFPCDSIELARSCIRYGFSIAPGVLFSSGERYRRFIRLNAGLTWGENVRRSVVILGGMARQQLAQ